jgi:predicted DNA-binding protein (UPF0251 family)
MLLDGSSLKVVRTHGGDEVLAGAASRHTRSMTPDLFSMASARVPLPAPNPPPSLRATADAPTASFRRHVLPKDLPAAIKQLDDQELDRLLVAAVAEQRRRGRKPAISVETPDKPRTEAAVVHLTPGKMNAVRAAFKVGLKPGQIARQFGLSQSDVRQALASDASR